MKNVPRSVDDVAKDVERIGKLVDNVLDDLDEIKRAIEVKATLPRKRNPDPIPPGPAPTVQNLRLDAGEKGRAIALFDGGKPVPLTPALAALLAILKFDDGEPQGELVAWKSLDAIGALLEHKFRRAFKHHSVSNLLNRLREVLKEAGLDRRLIESEKLLGARLRLKRRATGLCAG